MSNGSFRRALLDVDRELAGVPLARARDIRAAVAGRRRRRVAWHVASLAAAAAIAVVAVWFTRSREPDRQLVAGFEITGRPASWQLHGDAVDVLAPVLELDVPGFGRLVARRGARIARISGGVRVVRGHVDVDVHRRMRGLAPALVQVSHGTIVVLGTRFTIDQAEAGGRVVLHDGRIRFDAGSRSVALAPGFALAWPLAPQLAARSSEPATAAAPPPAAPPSRPRPRAKASLETPAPSPSPAPEEAPPAAPDVDKLIAEVASLRAQRQFEAAAALLERALTVDLPPVAFERLSYELGDIATYQLGDVDRACVLWRSHRTRFPQGRYTDEVAAATRRLGCEGTP